MVAFVIVVVAAGSLIGGAIWAMKALARHTSNWADSTAARGFDLEFDVPGVLDLPFDIFQRVSDRTAWTQISQSNSPDRTFLYKFEVGRGESERKERRTCTLIDMGGDSPHTTVRPHALHTLPPAPTDGDDVEVPPTAFTELFHVQASDPNFATKMLGHELTTWLLTPEGRCGTVEIELRGRWLVAVGPRVDTPEQLMDFHAWGQQLKSQLVAVVR